MGTVEIGVDLETIVCNERGCGIAFAVPADWVEQRRKDHNTWYCPNGHQRYFPQKSEEERLREALASARGNEKYYRELSERRQRSLSATRGVVTRLKNKACRGECPWCEMVFPDLQAHVKEIHPGEDPESVPEAES